MQVIISAKKNVFAPRFSHVETLSPLQVYDCHSQIPLIMTYSLDGPQVPLGRSRTCTARESLHPNTTLQSRDKHMLSRVDLHPHRRGFRVHLPDRTRRQRSLLLSEGLFRGCSKPVEDPWGDAAPEVDRWNRENAPTILLQDTCVRRQV